MRNRSRSGVTRGVVVGLIGSLWWIGPVGPATALLPRDTDEDVRGAAYCTDSRIEGFEAPDSAMRELACEAGARGELLEEGGAFALAHRELSRSLAGWDLPIGHLLLAKVEANLGRPLEALTQVWLAARHGARGLQEDELRLLSLMERHLLDRQLGQVSMALERGETLEHEGLIAAVGPTRSALVLMPGLAHLSIRVRGVEARRWVVGVRPGRRYLLERDGGITETGRDPDDTPALAVSRVGVSIDLRALVAEEESGDPAAVRGGQTDDDAQSTKCRGLEGGEAKLCLGLEAERRRFELRLAALDSRKERLLRKLREFTR